MPLPTWTLLDEQCQPTIGERNFVLEVWGTENLDAAGLGDNPTDLTTLVDSCPPQYGDPHPDPRMAGALVRWKRCIYGPARNRAKVAVFYDSAIQYSFGDYYSRGVSGSSQLMPHHVPALSSAATGVRTLVEYGYRVHSTRVVTCFSSAFNPDLVQHTINENAGAWYFFRTRDELQLPDFSVSGDAPVDHGQAMLLSGGRAVDLNNGMKKAVYEFTTTGRVRKYAAGDIGSAVDTPELGYLDEYAVTNDGSSWSVTAKPFWKIYPKGNPLPTGNVFRPIP